MSREHDGIADWVINELCDELDCDGDEIVERVRRLSAKADTYEKAYNTLGDEHFVLLVRLCKMQAEIKKILPDFNGGRRWRNLLEQASMKCWLDTKWAMRSSSKPCG